MSGARKYRKLTDEQLLELLQNQTYTVDIDSGTIYSQSGEPLSTFVGGRTEREAGYLFVRLHGFSGRRGIAVHKLVWMAGTLSCVPKDFEVHHRDLDNYNNNFKNLFALHKVDHNKLHGRDLLEEDVPF